MPIEPAQLASSLGALGSLDVEQGLAVTLQQVLGSAKTLLDADRAGLLLLDRAGALRWASGSDRLVEAGVGDLTVPVQLGGGQMGTLDLYDPGPREWMMVTRPPCGPMPGWSPACSRPQWRRGSPAGWPT